MGTPAEKEVREPRAPAPVDPGLWVEAHGDAMYRYALLRLGSPDLAEEAVQEAMVSALKALETFQGRSSERTWLIGILRHKVLDVIRSRRRERDGAAEMARLLETRDAAFRDDGRWAQRVASSSLGGSAERAELRQALLDRIGRLPPAMREAFCLRELDGLDSAVVCEIMGISPTNLWTLIHRAKVRLREALESDGHGRGANS